MSPRKKASEIRLEVKDWIMKQLKLSKSKNSHTKYTALEGLLRYLSHREKKIKALDSTISNAIIERCQELAMNLDTSYTYVSESPSFHAIGILSLLRKKIPVENHCVMIEFYLDLLENPVSKVRKHAAAHLYAFREAIPSEFHAKILKHLFVLCLASETYELGIFVLIFSIEQKSNFVDRLLDSTKDSNEEIRERSILALKNIFYTEYAYDHRTLPEEELIPQNNLSKVLVRILELLRDPEEKVTTTVAEFITGPNHSPGRFLKKLPKEPHKKVIEKLLDLTKDSNATIRRRIVKIFRTLFFHITYYGDDRVIKGVIAPELRFPILTRLFEMFSDSDESVADESVFSFICLSEDISKKEVHTILQKLLDLTKESDAGLRAKATRCILALWEETSAKFQEIVAIRILSLISDSDPDVRRNASQGLGRIKESKLMSQDNTFIRILQLTEDPDLEVRKGAVRSLGYLGLVIPVKFRGKVVIALLELCKEEIYQKDVGNALNELSKHWDLGEAIPSKQRTEIAEQVIKLEAEKALFSTRYIEVKQEDGTAYNWRHYVPQYDILTIKESIYHAFNSLFNKRR